MRQSTSIQLLYRQNEENTTEVLARPCVDRIIRCYQPIFMKCAHVSYCLVATHIAKIKEIGFSNSAEV